VFLALAPFMEKSQLCQIFGKNLLDDATQETGYLELLGLHGYKPFECVGEIKESLAAFQALNSHPAWQNDYLIKKLTTEVAQNALATENLDSFLHTHSTQHALSQYHLDILDAFSRSS
jgi:hypothetical protein